MITGSNKPTNSNWNQINLNNGGWVIIAILICIIVILIAVTLIIYFKSRKTIAKLQEFSQNEISDEERDLLLQYRKLDIRDKNVIINTISTLSQNHQDNDLIIK